MILSAANLAHHLVDRGIVPAETVVDGDFVVVEATRRNRNFQVVRGPHPGLFVKQPQDWQPHSTETMAREAACYALAHGDPDFAALAPLLPRLVHWDAQRMVLVTERVEGENVAEMHRRLGAFPAQTGARLGTLLGGYHREAGARARDAARDAVFPRSLPWILSVLDHNPSHLGPVSGGCTRLLGILEAYPGFRDALAAVRDGWVRDALVHGDMKWENCLVSPPAAEGDEPRVRIVDWELADFGDACWDVGSLFQSYLAAWIFSIRAGPEVPPVRLPELAERPLSTMQPAIAAFWAAYLEARGADPAAEHTVLLRSTAFAAARMVQTAWEYTAFAPEPSAHVLFLLQVAMNVLTRPEEAARELLGIAPARRAA